MEIEKIRMKVTLKTVNGVYVEGRVITSPIPQELLDEIRMGTDAIEVLPSEASVSSDVSVEQQISRTKRVKR